MNRRVQLAEILENRHRRSPEHFGRKLYSVHRLNIKYISITYCSKNELGRVLLAHYVVEKCLDL